MACFLDYSSRLWTIMSGKLRHQKPESAITLHPQWGKREKWILILRPLSPFIPGNAASHNGHVFFSTLVNPITIASNRHACLSPDDSRTHQVDTWD